MNTTTARIDDPARRLLKTQLEGIVLRLRNEGDVPQVAFAGGDFLDVAQDVEQQELARLTASRLTERARRLRIALARLQDGEYRVCSDCEAPIPPKRPLALPDTTTCVACQERLERVGQR